MTKLTNKNWFDLFVYELYIWFGIETYFFTILDITYGLTNLQEIFAFQKSKVRQLDTF